MLDELKLLDEIKLLEQIRFRKEYLEAKVAEYNEVEDTANMDIFDNRLLELEFISNIITQLVSSDETVCYRCKHYRHGSRDSFPCSECVYNYDSMYEPK